MLLSDISVKRPVFASVISLLLIAFGIVAFQGLPLREYPDIDPPIVTVTVDYPGAPANVIETRVTKIIEDRISGVAGIEYIESSSQDGRSNVTIEFSINRNIDSAANDIRDRISGIAASLPEEAQSPEVKKVDSSDDVVIWQEFVSDYMTVPELTDYAKRYLVDKYSILDGVARVRIGGGLRYAMRIWVDRKELAARNLTINDIERALRAENIELPAGSLESSSRMFQARLKRNFKNAADFKKLVLSKGANGYLVRLKDVARVEKGLVENRILFRGNRKPMVGIGIIKQSNANTIAVAEEVKKLSARLDKTLPKGLNIKPSYDSSVFIQASITEVYKTLFIALLCVVLVMFLFLGDIRAIFIPAITVPISLIATFTVVYAMGFSINILTLLALVLAIGLVVDDTIVVLENIVRHIKDKNETPLLAAYNGTRQVGFAVIATTLVLLSVFVPITFLKGDIGRLFTEFAVTLSAAVAFSALVALTLSPMLASKLLKKNSEEANKKQGILERLFLKFRGGYMRILSSFIKHPLLVVVLFATLIGATAWIYPKIPQEFVPQEDRGVIFVIVKGPEGATYKYIKDYMNEIENRLMPYVEDGTMKRLIIRAPLGFGNISSFNGGMAIIILNKWGKRRPIAQIVNELRGKLFGLPGVLAFPIIRQGLGGGTGKPVQFVLGGATYEKLAKWRDILLKKIAQENPRLKGVDTDYKETRPQIDFVTDYDRAAELGVTEEEIGRTLETLMGGRKITTFIDNGEEYDVIVEGERGEQRSFSDVKNIYVRSLGSKRLIPLSNLVHIDEYGSPQNLSRYNRVKAITIEANLAEGYHLGEALEYMRKLVRDNLPDDAVIDYKGQSRDFINSGKSIIFVFILGLIVVFLVLAAQFENYIHPFVIMLTIPLAMGGGLFGLYITGASLNIYSEIALIMLIGLAAKNGILVVEFANQLRNKGMEFSKALLEACEVRFRPIIMTGLTTVAGAIPLVMANGAGSEVRSVIGIVILFGVFAATIFTLLIVPVAYSLIARHTTLGGQIAKQLEYDIKAEGSKV